MLKPKRITNDACPGLELFTFKEIGNPLTGNGDENRLKRLIEHRLDELRRRAPNTSLDGTTFCPLVDEGHSQKGDAIEAAAKSVADEIWSSSAQNPMLASLVFKQYWSKLEKIGFAINELMTPLLVSQEELLFPDMPTGAEKFEVAVPAYLPEQAGQRISQGGSESLEPQFASDSTAQGEFGMIAPPDTQIPAMPGKMPMLPEVIEVRLVSIREMLKIYFKEYPEDYAKALSCALGLVSGEGVDEEFVSQRVAFEVARVGSWALALRVLEEIKKKQAKDGKGPDPWRMGLRVGGRGRKKKPWNYTPANDTHVFCPRWMGLGWSASVGMLSTFISRQ